MVVEIVDVVKLLSCDEQSSSTVPSGEHCDCCLFPLDGLAVFVNDDDDAELGGTLLVEFVVTTLSSCENCTVFFAVGLPAELLLSCCSADLARRRWPLVRPAVLLSLATSLASLIVAVVSVLSLLSFLSTARSDSQLR